MGTGQLDTYKSLRGPIRSTAQSKEEGDCVTSPTNLPRRLIQYELKYHAKYPYLDAATVLCREEND